jgi:hypothetical protein
MKWLKMIGLGIVVWSLSLVWPEINNVVTWEVMLFLALALAGLVLAYALQQYLKHHHRGNGHGQNHHHLPPDQTGPLAVLRHLT